MAELFANLNTMNPDDAKIKILYHQTQIAELEKKLEATVLEDIIDSLQEMVCQEEDEEISVADVNIELIRGEVNKSYRKLIIEIPYLLL